MAKKTRFEIERQKAIERVRAKGGDESKVCKTASEFLDTLTDFLSDCDGLTNEEIRADLIEQGIDVDAALERIMKLLHEHGIKLKVKRTHDESSIR